MNSSLSLFADACQFADNAVFELLEGSLQIFKILRTQHALGLQRKQSPACERRAAQGPLQLHQRQAALQPIQLVIVPREGLGKPASDFSYAGQERADVARLPFLCVFE